MVMVTKSSSNSGFTKDKVKVAKANIPTMRKLENIREEMQLLKSKNKMLTDCLKTIHELASEKAGFKHELVWYAKNRTRYPCHEDSKRIETSEEHQEDIEKLRGYDGDYHHGFNAGVLAMAHLVQDLSDSSHHEKVLDSTNIATGDTVEAFSNSFSESVDKAKTKFPDLRVNVFPSDLKK